MTVAFVRQLGAEPGVQLNPLRDNSEIPSTDNSDQIFGIVMRATRGRIDKPFAVDAGNVYTKLGYGEQIRVNALNLAWVHVVEALNNGAYQAVVQRLSTAKSKIKWAVVRVQAAETSAVGEAKVGKSKTGAKTVAGKAVPTYAFEVSEEEPSGEFLFAVKHLECFNDGIKVAFRAEEKRENGKNVANNVITVQIIDPHEDNVIYEFTGSLDINAKDDYGNSYYLPDVVESQTDAVELKVGMSADKAKVEPDTAAYGYDENGSMAWAESDTLLCFDEGTTTYETEDYLKARNLLQNSEFDYAYISSGKPQLRREQVRASPARLLGSAQVGRSDGRQSEGRFRRRHAQHRARLRPQCREERQRLRAEELPRGRPRVADQPHGHFAGLHAFAEGEVSARDGEDQPRDL